MSRRIVAALIASGMALAAMSSSAIAQGPPPATGVPGEPNCHGQRVSYGSSVVGITPKDRAGFLHKSVQEFQERVRASCEVQEQD